MISAVAMGVPWRRVAMLGLAGLFALALAGAAPDRVSSSPSVSSSWRQPRLVLADAIPVPLATPLAGGGVLVPAYFGDAVHALMRPAGTRSWRHGEIVSKDEAFVDYDKPPPGLIEPVAVSAPRGAPPSVLLMAESTSVPFHTHTLYAAHITQSAGATRTRLGTEPRRFFEETEEDGIIEQALSSTDTRGNGLAVLVDETRGGYFSVWESTAQRPRWQRTASFTHIVRGETYFDEGAVVAAHGAAAFVWLNSAAEPARDELLVSYRRAGSTNWHRPLRVARAVDGRTLWHPTVTIAPSGAITIGYGSYTEADSEEEREGDYRTLTLAAGASRFAPSGSITRHVIISNPLALLATASGLVAVWAHYADGAIEVMSARRLRGAWQSAQRVRRYPQKDEFWAVIAVADLGKGRVLASWIVRNAVTSTRAELGGATLKDGRWGNRHALELTGSKADELEFALIPVTQPGRPATILWENAQGVLALEAR